MKIFLCISILINYGLFKAILSIYRSHSFTDNYSYTLSVGQYIIDNLSKLKAADIATFSEILARNHAKPEYEFHRTSWDVPFWTAIGDKHFLEWYQRDNFLHLTIRDMQKITKALEMRFHNKLKIVLVFHFQTK